MATAQKLEERIYTYGDLLKFPEEERWELIDGVPYLQARPSFDHQKIMSNIHGQMWNYFKDKPCELVTETAVWLEGKAGDIEAKGYVVPDILVVCDQNKIIANVGIAGTPDLIVEIVSPSNAFMDRNQKLEEYRKAGVREYWVVEPEGRYIAIYRLKENAYWITNYNEGIVPSAIFPDLTIDLDMIFPKTG
jgi:Uma2 family endonuclease